MIHRRKNLLRHVKQFWDHLKPIDVKLKNYVTEHNKKICEPFML